MAAGRYTSRVFVVGRALKAALTAATFPPHPVTGKTPAVEFSDEDPSLGAETISVALNEDLSAFSTWARLSPPGRDETITFDVVFRTVVPNAKTSADIWDRLEAVSAVIEGVVYDTALEAVIPFAYSGEVQAGAVSSVVPNVFPGPEGWLGQLAVSFTFLAEI